MNHELITDLSSHRFYVDYLFFTDTIDKAYELAKELCVEQSIEFPPDLLPERDIFNRIIRVHIPMKPSSDSGKNRPP